MKNKAKYILLVLFLPYFLFGQIEIDKPIVFISTNESDRFINDIETTTNIDLLNSKEVIVNQYQYATTFLQNDTLFAIFNPKIEALNLGLKLYLRLPLTILNSINYLKINDLIAVNIYLYFDDNFEQNSLNSDEIFTAIFDGVSFQTLLRADERTCPDGFVDINDKYCVSQTRQGPGTFYQNITYCNSLNARLCSWSEWFYACKNNGGNISDMSITGLEWVDTGGNGKTLAKVVGSTNCYSHGFGDTKTASYYFRCCYTK